MRILKRLALEGLIVYLPKYPVVTYGDNIIVEGKVSKKRLQGTTLISLNENKGFLCRFRQKLLEVHQRTLSQEHGALMEGN